MSEDFRESPKIRRNLEESQRMAKNPERFLRISVKPKPSVNNEEIYKDDQRTL